MRFWIALALRCWLLLSSAELISADEVSWTGHDLAPLEQQLLGDAAAGQFERFSLLEAALVAAGCDDAASLERYASDFAARARTFDLPADAPGSGAAAMHAWLYDRILTAEYCSEVHDPHVTLDCGDYNCLTATVLFIALAKASGARARALETPGHIAVVVTDDGGEFLVETTLRPAAELSAGQSPNVIRGPVVALTEPAVGRKLTDVQLVARCFYNRGVAALERGDYRQALLANRAAFRLDSSCSAAFENLLATLNNWSLARAREGDPQHGLELLEWGRALGPEHAAWSANRRWIEALRPAVD